MATRSSFGVPPATLHTFLGERQARWPRALSPTATHDTKRGEDTRARLNVLSELPGDWRDALTRWSDWNKPHRVALEDESAPDLNEEYFLYQTLVGVWPIEPAPPQSAAPPGPAVSPTFAARIQEYMHKALHEAKAHSSWINPNPPYDEAIHRFTADVLNPEKSGPFLADLQAFIRRVSHYGLLNSLAQALVKFTAPGVPDTYQGTELWDFSLVDPDNRQPVDFDLRAQLLDELKAGPVHLRELLDAKEDGRVKLYLTWRALCCRRAHPGLFSDGAYLPVEAGGTGRQHVFSFIRRHDDQVALVVVPRWLTRLLPEPGRLPLGAVWGDTHVLLPEDLRGRSWRNVLSDEVVPAAAQLSLGAVLAQFPVALLLADN